MCAPKEKMQDPIRNTKWNGNPDLPENYDKELLESPIEEDPSDMLKGKR